MKRIMKYGLLIVRNNRILLQKEKDEEKLLLPGGRPKRREDYLKCLRREIKEELDATINENELQYLGKFEDSTADGKSELTIELYLGTLKDTPKPSGEVEKIIWFGLKNRPERLSPVIRNKIMPYLKAVNILT